MTTCRTADSARTSDLPKVLGHWVGDEGRGDRSRPVDQSGEPGFCVIWVEFLTAKRTVTVVHGTEGSRYAELMCPFSVTVL